MGKLAVQKYFSFSILILTVLVMIFAEKLLPHFLVIDAFRIVSENKYIA